MCYPSTTQLSKHAHWPLRPLSALWQRGDSWWNWTIWWCSHLWSDHDILGDKRAIERQQKKSTGAVSEWVVQRVFKYSCRFPISSYTAVLYSLCECLDLAHISSHWGFKSIISLQRPLIYTLCVQVFSAIRELAGICFFIWCMLGRSNSH